MADGSVQCRKCGSEVPRSATSCPGCGARLGASNPSARALRPAVTPVRGTSSAPAPAPTPASVPLPIPAPIPRRTNAGLSVSADPLIGRKLQEYVLEERIGVGGMGVVYRAVQPMIGKHVAVKVLRAEILSDPRDVDRLLEEARIVNRIKHRGIINIFGAGTLEDGRNYLIMELLEGESLEQRMVREGRIPAADAVVILEQVLAALAAAHEVGIVHRDLKPANVFLASEGEKIYVKLLDFGLARPAQQNVTRIAGTPDYISPEHARGRPAGPPADLYAFGILCFHMLTGRLPYSGNTPLEVMEKHVHAPPPVLGDVEPSLPKALTELVLRLMAKEPGERPEAPQVLADLRAATRQLRAMPTMMSLEAVEVAEPGGSEAEARRARELAVEAQLGDIKRKVRRTWPTLAVVFTGLWLAGVVAYVYWPSSSSQVPSSGGALDGPGAPTSSSGGARGTEVRGSDAGTALGALPPRSDGSSETVTPDAAAPGSAVQLAELDDSDGGDDGLDGGPHVEAATELDASVDDADGGAQEAEDLRAPLDDFQLGELKRAKRLEDRLTSLELIMKDDGRKRVRFENEFRLVKQKCEAAVSKRDVLLAEDDLRELENGFFK